MALAVPLSRFTPQVGGGSAFFVRPHMRADHPKAPTPADRRISWSIYLLMSVSFCAALLVLEPWGFLPALPGGAIFWIALAVGGVTGFVVNLVRPRYEISARGWRAFYDFLLKQLPPPD